MSLICNVSRFQVVIGKSLAFATFLVLLTLALCGCGGGTSTPINYTGDGTSGLRGVVTGYGSTLGATPQPIPNATVSAYGNSTSSSSGPRVGAAPSPVAQTQSDAQGNYSLSLIPGSYTVSVFSASSTNGSGGGEGSATVTTHQFVSLNLVINYGTP